MCKSSMETATSVLERLQPIFSKVMDIPAPEVTFEASRTQFPKWDSWAHLELVTEIEAEFDCSFTMEETVGIRSVRDIVELIGDRTAVN
jgi:acyl carrier protein